MPVFDIIFKTLSSHIKKSFVVLDLCDIPQGVFLIENEINYAHNCIYVGTWKEVQSVLNNSSAPKHTTFFVSNADSLLLNEIKINNAYNVIFTDLSLIKLNNLLTSITMNMHHLSDSYINPAFNHFIYEITLNNQNNVDDLMEISRKLEHKILQYFNFIIIKFESLNFFLENNHRIFSELSDIFTNCNIAICENKIVILYTQNKRYVKLPENIKFELDNFLIKYNAIASAGTPFRDFNMLKTEYRICANLLKIVSHLDDKNKSRIFSEDDFGPYFIIDLCARKYEELFSNNDIIYLVHPGLIALSRYDSKHNTNLRELLYHYLSNDRNLSKTAKEMFMHRNTVLNKLNKINEIIDDDLDNYAVRFRLTFSFMIIKYYEQVKGLTLNL